MRIPLTSAGKSGPIEGRQLRRNVTYYSHALRLFVAACSVTLVVASGYGQTVQISKADWTPAWEAARDQHLKTKPNRNPVPQQPPPGDPDYVGTGTSGTPGVWLNAANWSPANVPTPSEIANFGNGATFVGIDLGSGSTNNGAANQAVGAITLTGSNNMTIGNSSTTTAGTLTLNGTTVNTVANTILSNTSSGKTLTLQNAVTPGTQTVTIALGNVANIINATAGNSIVISSVINQVNAGSAISFTGGGNLTLSGVNLFSGGLTIAAGTVGATTSTSALGTGTVTLGDTSGSANATLLGDGHTFGNAIAVAAGSSGTLTIGNSGNASAVFSGAVTLNNNLTLASNGNGSVKLSGGVTGTGNITLRATGAGSGTFLDTTLVNNTGTITNSGTGTGGVTIAALLGGNVTQLIQNSATSSLTLNVANNNAFVGSVAVNAGTLFMAKASALNAANVVSVASGATFDINGNSETIAGLNTGTGTVTNSGALKTLTLGGSGNYIFGGNITGTTPANMALAISLTSGGSQTLNGASNYAGGTTLNSGTLIVNNASAIGTGALTVTANSTLGNTSGNAITLANTNNINLTGGTLTFSGPNDLSFGNNVVAMTGNRTISVTGGGTLTIGSITEDTPPRNFTKSGNGTLILIGASTYTGTTNISNGTLQLGNGGATGSVSINSTISDGGNLAFNRNNAVVQGTDFTSAVISGAGTITQLGSGSLTLNSANTYAGGTTLSAGTLNINNAGTGTGSAIGTGKLTISGVSTIDNTSGSAITISTNNLEAWNSSFTFLGSNDLNLGTGAITLGGSGTLTASASTLTVGGSLDLGPGNNNTRTLTINGGGNVIFNGVVQNTGTNASGSLTYAGTGTLTLNGNDTYSGTTTLSSGTVAIGNDNAFGTSALAIAGGTLSAVGGPHSIANATTLGVGGGTIAGANDLTFTGSFTETGGDRTLTVSNTGTTTFNAVNLSGNNTGRTMTVVGAGNIVFNGTVGDGGTGPGGLIFDSGYTGTATINGANTYFGGTTLSGGTFVLGNKSAFGTGSVTWGGVSVSASTNLSGANAVANNGTLKNTNTFTGTNNIELSGTLTNTDNSGVIRNNMAAGSSLTISGTLNLSNNTNARTVTFSGSGNTIVSGLMQNGSTAPENIVKANGGTLQVTNVATYTGTTTINAGVLDINSNATTTGALAGTSSITVNNSGTLMLSNSGSSSSIDRINDAATMTLNGGTFKTGGLSEHGATNNTAGIGALTLQSNSIINLGNGASVIAFANSSSQAWTPSTTLSIYNWTGSPSGGGTDQVYFGNDNTGLTASQLAEITFYSDSGVTALGIAQILADGEIVPVAVPEPGTWFAAALLASTLIFLPRRSKESVE